MKIEILPLNSADSDNPFRYPVWAVLRNNRVCAWCLSPEVANALVKALTHGA